MKKYRPNVGIVVFRSDGKVLLCERVEDYPKRWQFPQGGIDDGETPLQAAVRELREETSVTSVKFVCSLDKSIKYDFPPEGVISLFPSAFEEQIGIYRFAINSVASRESPVARIVLLKVGSAHR